MANPGLKADFGLTLELFQDGETQDDAFLADAGLTLELEPPPAPPAFTLVGMQRQKFRFVPSRVFGRVN